MTEYVVEWQHWRYPDTVDEYRTWYTEGQISAGLADAWVTSERLRPVGLFRHWRLTANRYACVPSSWTGPSGHGGKTICYIYQPNSDEPNDLMLVAHDESVCSWRDQFSRRAGRLYSLALALNKLDWDHIDKYRFMYRYKFVNLSSLTDIGLSIAFNFGEEAQIKAACALIVAAWRKPKRIRAKPTPEQIEAWRTERTLA